MPSTKLGEAFGLDPALVDNFNWGLALKRIHYDLRSDFIYSPHLSFLYRKAGDELIAKLQSDLKSGKFTPGIPITIEVPKSLRIRVAVRPKRFGPNYTRPGSILPPKDRLLYQALVDQAAPIIGAKVDPERSFSHLLSDPNSAAMFLATRTCRNKLQQALSEYSKPRSIRYVLKVDIASFFGSINQHTLINILNDSGFEKPLSDRLEVLLTTYTGQRSSRGILQGLFPSDLLGNFYLTPIDRFLEDYGVPSARYVDDLYMFLKSVERADELLRKLIPYLRSYDLVLNEAKSLILPKSALQAEEPDLEALFMDAISEISSQMDDEEFHADYGFQSEWDEEDLEEEDLELKATKLLFDSIDKYSGKEENIERFCLPLFTTAATDHAIHHVMDSFKRRPAMTQIYASYLSRFVNEDYVRKFLLDLLGDGSLYDWQKIWVLAALYLARKANDKAVKVAFGILNDANRHEALRAVAAVYIGSNGDHLRRKSLVSIYPSVSPYVQAAIYYSSKSWPPVERKNVKATWGGHHALLTIAMTKS